ncbi:MAG: hypothetical protein IJS73_03225 [Paludibacteraceae bacterium]|nr:hypothetical protein [Paludibacteraceae bacterium]
MSAAKKKKGQSAQPQRFDFNLVLAQLPQENKYINLQYGIRLNVQDARANQRILQIYDASPIYVPNSSTNPAVTAFVEESMRRYMRTMGFNIDADIETDYLMQIEIKEFHSDWLYGVGWNGTIIFDIKVLDHSMKLVYPTVEITGRASVNGPSNSVQAANIALNNAYVNALKDIDWDRIAFFLHKTQNNADKANNANSAITKAPIHWDIQSRPQGADIYWRVVSSTEEVKNQNSKYLETTPYETTEPFDIKGLTYENSEQVQIEIRCEKEGYATQKKRFNLNSILDEKELSVFFKLVKIEEE